MSKRTSEAANLPPIEAEAGSSKKANVNPAAALFDTNNNPVIVGTATSQGERDDMYDRHVVQTELRKCAPVLCDMYCSRQYMPLDSRMSYFALFDGHAGSAAATFACDTFLKKLPQLCEKYSAPSYSGPVLVKNVKKIFVNMFKDVEEDFLVQARSSTPPLKDGSTATLLLLIDDYLYTANLGDTRAVLGRKKTNDAGETVYLAMPITVDHTAMKAEEQARIRKAGGFIKDGRVQGVIEISRSIGDFGLKAFGLCAQPDIQKVCLSHADKFVILACDGLWNVFTNDEAVTFVVRKIRAGIHKINNDEDRHVSRTNPNFSPLKNGLLCSVAADLMKAAIARGSKDNITIILIGFKGAMLDT